MKTKGPQDLWHNPEYVAGLFDRMAATYGVLNYITSFGFSERWRKECVHLLGIPSPTSQTRGITAKGPEDEVVYDLMTGMGEAWPSLTSAGISRIVSVDLSPGMCGRARENAKRYNADIEVLQKDVMTLVDSGQADYVVCCFGLKTLSDSDRTSLAQKTRELLKPGGRFAFVEISAARSWWLGFLYRFYLRRVIPLLGRLFGGDALAYGMLGKYTESFGDCRQFAEELQNEGLSAQYRSLFFGCASTVSGSKPED